MHERFMKKEKKTGVLPIFKKKKVGFPFKPNLLQKNIMEIISKSFSEVHDPKEAVYIACQTGGGKSLAILCPCLFSNAEHIICITRTNLQAQNLYKEFKITSYFDGTSVTILSSRAVLCGE